MENNNGFHYEGEIAWCVGCGDFGILRSLEAALLKLGKKQNEVLVVSGIGQAAKLPHYLNANGFNGLHGRALPPAFGAKVANRDLTVIVASGDGDLYGEGGNHFIHTIRRNIDITVIAHNNQIYGLTKGQASPTTGKGMVTKAQPEGVVSTPFDPISVAITLEAAFVARSFSREIDYTAELIVEAVNTPGFALIDILQPCVTFNKLNTYQWYGERVYRLDGGHDPTDKLKAYELAQQWGDKIPIGVFYKNVRPTYTDMIFDENEQPLYKRRTKKEEVKQLIREFY
jgi:2-oxoglutarate ferredoxin oxidoreductase subunit beta